MLAVGVYHAEELNTGSCIFSEGANHLARYHRHIGFMNTACRHALVFCFNNNADALWLQNVLDAIGDLRGHFFLNLKASSESFYYTR